MTGGGFKVPERVDFEIFQKIHRQIPYEEFVSAVSELHQLFGDN